LLRIKHIIDKHGVKGFSFRDDNFFTSPDRAYQILEGMVQQKLGIVWAKGDIRLDLLSRLSDDFLSLIERSGCHYLSIGIESGSQRIADLLRKEIDVSQAVSVNQRLTRYKKVRSASRLKARRGITRLKTNLYRPNTKRTYLFPL
jgi:radical SAM superfamily enzyme YgiQ (UPF0313 family)